MYSAELERARQSMYDYLSNDPEIDKQSRLMFGIVITVLFDLADDIRRIADNIEGLKKEPS